VTAEVGVLNRSGVALAADSAVSVGRDADKIYTSANKIFQLSCVAPVGVMIYGNANLVGLPWETIIKVYRRELGEKRFDTLHEYAEHLIAFVGENADTLFPKEQQNRHTKRVIYGLFEEIAQQFGGVLFSKIAGGQEIDDSQAEEILFELINEVLAKARAAEILPGFSVADRAKVKTRYRKEIEAVSNALFRAELLSDRVTKALKTLAAETFCRRFFGGALSGVVVAGFGETQHMSAITSYELEEMALGKLRWAERKGTEINHETDALVAPFAQDEMVYSFMEGVDRELLGVMEASTRDLFTGVIQEIINLISAADSSLGSALESAVVPRMPDLLQKLFNGWQHQRERFWKPVLTITSALPKDELASMAEALVNLTKFKRRVTMARETVGGPIDVAVITKGDGFVWVKRKHYFSPDLNPRVIARYQQGG